MSSLTISGSGSSGLVAALIRSIAGAIASYTRREAAPFSGVLFHFDA
ncbi:hypothetical protein [Streptomyces sp. C3-3]|nr:hypothetical protein [Streptomyces sp. C3-3]MBQ1116416.1 hypothetical protein [Streptomyces sp. C3-3]